LTLERERESIIGRETGYPLGFKNIIGVIADNTVANSYTLKGQCLRRGACWMYL